jgi:hypothetical protein
VFWRKRRGGFRHLNSYIYIYSLEPLPRTRCPLSDISPPRINPFHEMISLSLDTPVVYESGIPGRSDHFPSLESSRRHADGRIGQGKHHPRGVSIINKRGMIESHHLKSILSYASAAGVISEGHTAVAPLFQQRLPDWEELQAGRLRNPHSHQAFLPPKSSTHNHCTANHLLSSCNVGSLPNFPSTI